MRSLTIKRAKSFVGCLAKMKVYIEDPAGELTINGTPCRKLGDLKNGAEKTFPIGSEAVKVFVIADKLSKDYCNEYYQLPAGEEDISLSGKNKLNPASGNAFRFDNNESEGIAANRKKGTKKGLVVLIIAVIFGFALGYALTSGLFPELPAEEKSFTANGMTITLTDAFRETEVPNYTVAYDSKKVAVFALKEAFTLADGFENYTVEEYAALVIQNNKVASEAKTIEGLVRFTYDYTNPETNDTYQYYSFAYKTKDAFWLVQFAVLKENAAEYDQQILQWAKSVSFAD